MSTPTADDPTGPTTGTQTEADTARPAAAESGGFSARYGRRLVRVLIYLTLVFLIGPVVITFVASFFESWTGVFPSGGLTLRNWAQALGLGGVNIGAQKGLSGFWTYVPPDVLFVLELPVLPDLTLYNPDVSVTLSLPGLPALTLYNPFRATVPTPIPWVLGFSMMLALGGVLVNLVAGVPIAYAVTRYDFYGRGWLNTFAVLPAVPGIILGIAFLKSYPNLANSIALIIGYSLLKIPYMVIAVQSSFDSMDLQQLEESARSLGCSWLRTFLTVIVPNAKRGIISGSIICWTLAAAEFNFSYIVASGGSARPFSLFLFENISNNPFLRAAAAVSIYLVIVVTVTALLKRLGQSGFSVGGVK